jgi:small subunit ribosomal protein S20
MPRHKSAIKRTRQNKHRAERNKAHLSKAKTLIKKVRTAKDKKEAVVALKNAVKYLDQLAAKGVLHRNTASNQKSKLTKFINKMR